MIKRWAIADIPRTEGFYPPESLRGVRVRRMGPRAAGAIWLPGSGEPARSLKLCGLSYGPLASLAKLEASMNGRTAPHQLSWPVAQTSGAPAGWEARIELQAHEQQPDGWLLGVRTARTHMETTLGERRWIGVALLAVEVEYI